MHALAVPAGAPRIPPTWGNPAHDLDPDLEVYDPTDELVASLGEGTSVAESVPISNPTAGTWSVKMKGFFKRSPQDTGTAAVERRVPRP
ncbi:hypothetical protein [Corallococcus sp. Z5C101001]|uniref:hypothetical protein n=1 Tax=Corallococcus sp. Z5C101001 TaxID=2596829 RepID=UPI00117F0D18|nr:hypothetical protein [Corallococcus sp. Z5C101001]TSC32238.1 hypothetical protein FOF48_09335 [Corallococcus sp. Z5C101001]